MACFYVYSDSSADLNRSADEFKKMKNSGSIENGILISNSIDTIKTQIWEKNRGKFKRFHTNYAEDTKEKLKEIRKYGTELIGKGHAKVTKIAGNIAGYSDKKDLNTHQLFVANFTQEFGSHIHKCLEEELNHTSEGIINSQNNLLNFLKNQKKKYENLSKISKDALNVNEYTRTIVSFLQNFTDDSILESVNSAVNEIVSSDLVKNKFLEVELPLVGNKKSVSKIIGLLDLFTYDSNGNASIIDFKTSSHTGNIKTNVYRYTLLEMYRRMLLQNDIAWNNCNMYIAGFLYKENGTFAFSKFTNIEETLEMKSRSNVSALISQHLPRTTKTLITEDLQGRLSKAKELNLAMYNSSFLNKLENENYTEYIKSRIKGNRSFKYHQENKWVTAIENGDKITIKFSDGTTQTVLFDEFIKKELAFLQEKEDEAVSTYISVLKSNDKESLNKIVMSDSENTLRIKTNLSKYLSSNWEVISNIGLESQGIITMYNRLSNTMEFIVLTKDHYLTRQYELENGNTVIDDIATPEMKSKYYGYDKLPKASLANIKLIKAMNYISLFVDVYPPDVKISDIKLISHFDGSATFNLNFDGFANTFRLLLAESQDQTSKLLNKNLFSDIYNNFNKLQFTSTEDRLQNEVAYAVMELDVDFPDHWNTLSLQKKIKHLEDILRDLKLKYPGEFTEDKLKQQVQTPVQITYAKVTMLISSLRNMLSDNLPKITSLGLTFLDSLVAGVYLTTKGEVKELTTDGYLVTGLVNGLESSISYRNPDETSRRIITAIDAYFTQIRKLFIDEIDEVNKASRRYFNYILDNILIGGRLTDAVLGYHSPYYRALMLKKIDKPDEIDPSFRFINPYANNNGLATYEADFLKVILWSINRKRIPSSRLDADIKKLSYEELEKNKEFHKKYVEIVNSDINFLNIPLKRASGARGTVLGIQAFLKGDKSFKQIYEDSVDRLHEFLNPQRLTSYQQQEREQKERELEPFNQFLEDSDSRQSRLENSLVTDYEWNFTQLANDFSLAFITYNALKKMLKVIDDLIFTLRALENMTGEDMSNRIDSIFKRIKVSIYNDNLVDKEYHDLMTFIGFAKSMGSYTKIALRPMLYFKEMTLGSLKNLTSIASGFIQNGEKITLPILIKAASIIYGEGLFKEKLDKLSKGLDLGEKDLLGLLNDEYAITDRDANALSDKLSSDNYGIFNVGTRTLFYNTVRPDWFNRMTIFVSKMIADGTWEAHTKGEDGKLYYDMSKDSRFKEFWKHRNESSYSSPEFEKQKALYIAQMKLFEAEGFTDLKYGQNGQYDPLPMAYTTRERDSIKEQIGLMYGFYDHEEKSILLNETWYQMFTLFLTYLPGELLKWVAVGRNTSVGTWIHEVDPIEKDKNGNPAKLYWEEDSLGNKIKTTRAVSADGKNNQPVISWSGTPVEGLLVSLIRTAHDLAVDRKHLRDNPQLWRNALLALFNLLFGALFGITMLRLMTGGSGDKRDLSTQQAIVYDLTQKIGNDIAFYDSVVRPISDFGFAGTQYISDIVGDSVKALTNGEYLTINAFYDNLSLFKDTHILD